LVTRLIKEEKTTTRKKRKSLSSREEGSHDVVPDQRENVTLETLHYISNSLKNIINFKINESP